MGKKIYVGNLTFGVSSSDLQQMFEEFGTVQSAKLSWTATRAAPKALASWR